MDFRAALAQAVLHVGLAGGGAGRLIRTENDRGLLIVCDPRMTRMTYGRRLRMALPPMKSVAQAEEAWLWLDEIAARS